MSDRVISYVIPQIPTPTKSDRVAADESSVFRIHLTITMVVSLAEPVPAPSGKLICMPGGYGSEWLNPGIRNAFQRFGSRLQVLEN